MIVKRYFVIAFCLLSLPLFTVAKGSYLSPEQFLADIYQERKFESKSIWLSKDDQANIADIMSHKYNRLRIRYWQEANDTVWILDEIGKEKPITIGIHILKSKIQQVKVLAFRESRGDEVRHDFFTRQFDSAELTKENMLNTHIDGITGATMSVRALTKTARLALWLNNKIQNKVNNLSSL